MKNETIADLEEEEYEASQAFSESLRRCNEHVDSEADVDAAARRWERASARLAKAARYAAEEVQ